MLTRFEHHAVTEMLGQPDTPPRYNGTLCFGHEWERTAFGIALALAKQGVFEWDDFRDELIAEIGNWEASHNLTDASWDYYERFLSALEKAATKSGAIDSEELASLNNLKPASA
ncbi:nitrile hydratase accessory protein [Roseovarius sp. CAU 1744]|uniref:nitrile hydratase accessory protein n=1 Tax=Roseovarius sp. CAU 1744 TaxID=3140368 RepID=UPI00325B3AF6